DLAQRVDRIGHADEMVVNVLKIDQRLARKNGLLAPQQGVEYIAQGNHGAPQKDQLLFDPVQVVDRLGPKVLEDLRLEVVQAVGKVVEHRHVIVDDRVHQQVSGQPRSALGQVGPLPPEAPGLFDVADRLAVDGDQVIRSEEDAQFAQLQLAAGLHLGFVKDDEIVARIFFDFGALVLMAAIFDGEGVKAEFERQFVEITAGRIRNVNPEDVGRMGAMIGDEVG